MHNLISIERLKKYIKASREFYKKFKLENITSESEIGLGQDIEKVINGIEDLQLQYDALLDSKEIDNKEASDALHLLLHCSLKDKEYDTQKAQFVTVLSYIERLEKQIKVLEQRYNLKVQQMVEYRDENYISKAVIRDKIGELEEDNYDGEQYQMCIEAKIDILKEIAEEE